MRNTQGGRGRKARRQGTREKHGEKYGRRGKRRDKRDARKRQKDPLQCEEGRGTGWKDCKKDGKK